MIFDDRPRPWALALKEIKNGPPHHLISSFPFLRHLNSSRQKNIQQHHFFFDLALGFGLASLPSIPRDRDRSQERYHINIWLQASELFNMKKHAQLLLHFNAVPMWRHKCACQCQTRFLSLSLNQVHLFRISNFYTLPHMRPSKTY